jgi:hypothetical protein
MTPKDRVSYIQAKFQKDYKTILAKVAGHDFELIGTKKTKIKFEEPYFCFKTIFQYKLKAKQKDFKHMRSDLY